MLTRQKIEESIGIMKIIDYRFFTNLHVSECQTISLFLQNVCLCQTQVLQPLSNRIAWNLYLVTYYYKFVLIRFRSILLKKFSF